MRRFWIGLALIGTASAACPPQFPFQFWDQADGFRICLPAAPAAAADGTGGKEISGFSIPRNTNLTAKRLTIVAGNYDLLSSAEPFGKFTANGVTFTRAKFEEGSAGHSTLHIIYTWQHGNSATHFDFEHRATNVENFDPGQRPREYDRAAQIKMTEQVMHTFRRTKQ